MAEGDGDGCGALHLAACGGYGDRGFLRTVRILLIPFFVGEEEPSFVTVEIHLYAGFLVGRIAIRALLSGIEDYHGIFAGFVGESVGVPSVRFRGHRFSGPFACVLGVGARIDVDVGSVGPATFEMDCAVVGLGRCRCFDSYGVDFQGIARFDIELHGGTVDKLSHRMVGKLSAVERDGHHTVGGHWRGRE